MTILKPCRYFVLFSLFVLAGSNTAQTLPRGDPEDLDFDPARLARLDDTLQAYVDEARIAGSVTLVLRDGEVVYSAARGMQDLESGVPMQEDSIFRIASQTKAIVSTAVMLLQERGELLISDPLSKYLPEWADARVGVLDETGGYHLEDLQRPITLRDLLTHTSGIGYGMGNDAIAQAWIDAGVTGWYLSGRDERIRETVREMAALPLPAQPGTQWIYGYNIDILGAVVEEVSGMSLADFLQQEIFEPLAMQDTYFFLPQDKADRLAVVYQPVEGGLAPVPAGDGMFAQGSYVDGPRMNYSGGAGLLSTARDYARFLQMTLNGGELDGVRILSPKTVQLMTTSHIGDIVFRPGTGMGLGFSVLEDVGLNGTPGTAGEYGWGGAYHSTYWVDPVEELVVVYLSQILGVQGLDDADKLRTGIYAAMTESEVDDD